MNPDKKRCGRRLIPFALRRLGLAAVILSGALTGFAQRGATVPWTTYEAEGMTVVGGTVLSPQYYPNLAASEASGRQCVQLNATGQYLQFTAQAAANALVVRYCVPDTADGTGTNYTLGLFVNGTFIEELPLTSMYSWLYGYYPFDNNPADGFPRNFFDEVRANGLNIKAGDVVRLQMGVGDTAPYYLIDLVDLEEVAPPLTQPGNSFSLLDFGADPTGTNDSTTALEECISYGSYYGYSVWMPPGNYKISSFIDIPSNLTIQGAGMWYTTLVGDPVLYPQDLGAYRVTLNGDGSNIHLSDFAIIGKLNYRADDEPNDGLGGSYGTNSTISRIWVEHTKTGAWIQNSLGLVIDSCRFRDTIADGCNVNVGMQSTIITNCTARGNGDDCFAAWPESFGNYAPGYNLITHCTAQLPFLANGCGLYGGISNQIQGCVFQDITYGCGILITTRTGNPFSGITTAQQCDLNRCGGFDPNGNGWRGAVQLCPQELNISGVNINNLNISNSVSYAFTITSPGPFSRLTGSVIANVNIPNYGIGVAGCNGLWAGPYALGSLNVSNCTIVDALNSSPGFAFNYFPSPFNYVSNNNAVTITGYAGAGGFLAIPGSLTVGGVTLPVTGISTGAFAACNLTAVTIPASVTNIGASAFANCTNLTGIVIPNSVVSIGSNAFLSCYQLAAATIGGSVTSIGANAFQGCSSLTSLVVPKSVASLGSGAFASCGDLTAAYFAGNAPAADATVFANDNNLTAYYLAGAAGWTSLFGGVPTAFWPLGQPMIVYNSLNFGVTDNQFGFTVFWATNQPVLIEACTNLANPVWITVQTNSLAGGLTYFADPLWTTHPGRFYRAQAQVGN